MLEILGSKMYPSKAQMTKLRHKDPLAGTDTVFYVRENVTGETQKGKREYFRCQGDIVWCGICRKYLFMPKNPDLNLVEVEYNEKSA